MPIHVEDGSGSNPQANSYVTVAFDRAYAEARGVALPEDDAAVVPLLTNAMDFIAAQEDRFQGRRAVRGQPLSFPRVGVVVYGDVVPDDEIPVLLQQAQCQLACDSADNELQPSATGSLPVIQETVDVVSVAYAAPQDGVAPAPRWRKALGFLQQLFKSGGAVHTVRI